MESDQTSTWLEWLDGQEPPPEHTWITRDGLIEALALDGVMVSARTLTRWERAGRTPRPVYRYRGNAHFALYPPYHAEFVKGVARDVIGDRDPKQIYRAESFAWKMQQVTDLRSAGAWFFDSGEATSHLYQLAELFAAAHGTFPASALLTWLDDNQQPIQRLQVKLPKQDL